MTETSRPTLLSSAANAALLFPVLSSAQIARIASHGVIRRITRGEVLIESGQTNVPFFVLKSGEIEVIRPSALDEILVAIVGPAQFTGDISMILDRPAQMRLRVRDSGEVVQLTRDQMHALTNVFIACSQLLDGCKQTSLVSGRRDLRCGLSEPGFESCFAKPGTLAGH